MAGPQGQNVTVPKQVSSLEKILVKLLSTALEDCVSLNQQCSLRQRCGSSFATNSSGFYTQQEKAMKMLGPTMGCITKPKVGGILMGLDFKLIFALPWVAHPKRHDGRKVDESSGARLLELESHLHRLLAGCLPNLTFSILGMRLTCVVASSHSDKDRQE